MAGRDLIVIGGSAGGLDALKAVAAGLPADLPAAVLATLHVAPGGPGLLPAILARAGPLPASHPRDGEAYETGRIYVAPPDRHLLVRDGILRLTRGARENLARPAVDPLFRSAAVAHGPRVIGVLLSGYLDDGTAGLSAVKRCGGVAVVQEPGDALYPSMPESALHNVPVDHCVPASEMAALLARLTAEPAGPAPVVPAAIDAEVFMTERQEDDLEVLDRIGSRSTVTCPECSGTLWELGDDPVQFRCHVGHAYSPGTLIADHSRRLEDALWAAIRGFEENATIAERVAARGGHLKDPDARERLHVRARTAKQHADALRKLIDTLPVSG